MKNKHPNNRLQRAIVKALCYIPVVPAVWVNLESSSVGFVAAGNVGSAFGAAIFLDAAVHGRKGRSVSLLMWLGFVICFSYNLANGLANISHHSAATTDARQGEINMSARLQTQLKDLDAQLVELDRSRAAQVALAGEASPAEISAAIDAEKSANATKWAATAGCDPLKTTTSKDFCSKVNELRKQQAAAEARVTIDGERKEVLAQRQVLNAKIDNAGAPPASADEFAASVESVAGVLGYTLSAEQRQSVRPLKNLLWALVIEVVAAVGPLALSLLFAGGSHAEHKGEGPASTKPASRARGRARDTILEGDTIVEKTGAPVQNSAMVSSEKVSSKTVSDPVVAFFTSKLETSDGDALTSAEVRAMWCEWAQTKGLDEMTAKAFTTSLKRFIQHEKKNGRSRWLNVKKRETTALRLAVSNV